MKWNETVDHPGHYRISFDTDGQDFVVPPTATESTEGMPNVIKDLIPDQSGPVPREYTFEITLPNVECTNCTLQLIQLMTDKPPYTTDAGSDDIYYQCADITLVAGPTDPGDMPGTPDAGTDGTGGSNSGIGGEIGGGCSTGNATGLLAILGLAGLRRRRR